MLTEHTVAEAARAAALEPAPLFFQVTGSTNQELLRRAEEGAPGWTLAVALHQESGRGRLGRTWVSSPGSSLLVSLLVRPDLSPDDGPVLALAAGAAMALACREACAVDARCKWPNDLVVDGRKLGGILVEAKVQGGRLLYAVIGSGVNLHQQEDDFPPGLRSAATSVAIENGRPGPEALLSAYLVRLKHLLEESAFVERTVEAYRDLCDTLGRHVKAATMDGREVVGRAEAIGDSGELLVRTSQELQPVSFGEIEHLE